MTVKYHGEYDAQSLIMAVDNVLRNLPDEAKPFRMTCSIKRNFGFKRKIRVLLPPNRLPDWVYALAGDAKWNPHVATEEERLDLVVDAVAIMSHKEEIYRWNLTATT